MKPPTRAVGREANRTGLSFSQSTKLLRLKSQVEYAAATILRSSAVGRISFEENEAKAINARKAVPPAWPTVAYSRDIAPNSSANIMPAIALLFLNKVMRANSKTRKCEWGVTHRCTRQVRRLKLGTLVIGKH
jgi:hypothetical protein